MKEEIKKIIDNKSERELNLHRRGFRDSTHAIYLFAGYMCALNDAKLITNDELVAICENFNNKIMK